MKMLLNLILVVILCWMIWGSIWTLRNGARALWEENPDPISSNNRHILAVIGFFFALAVVIYLPLYAILSHILPPDWGRYDARDGDFISDSFEISFVVAFIGSFGIMYRMSKIKRSVLNLEFWSKRFRPWEIKACFEELEKIKSLFNNQQFANIILDSTMAFMQSEDGCRKLIQMIKSNGISPRNAVLFMMFQITRMRLICGEFHRYRGVLNMVGLDINASLDILLNELVKNNFMDESQAKELNQEIARKIMEVG